MDSTFLGVLAGFGLKMSGSATRTAPNRRIELLNPNPRITELLENLGVLHLFKLAQGHVSLPARSRSPRPHPPSTRAEEVTRACLEAHQTLMDINPDNAARFKDVAQFLAEDLKQAQSGRRRVRSSNVRRVKAFRAHPHARTGETASGSTPPPAPSESPPETATAAASCPRCRRSRRGSAGSSGKARCAPA